MEGGRDLTSLPPSATIGDMDMIDALVNNTRTAIESNDADAIVDSFAAIVAADIAEDWTADYRTQVAVALGQQDATLGLKFLGSWMNLPTLQYLNAYCVQTFGEELGYEE